MEKSSISNRSTKLFALSSIKNATKALLRKSPKEQVSKTERDLAVAYWDEVSANMPDWQPALQKKVTTSELREQYAYAHGVMLQAMENLGADLVSRKKLFGSVP